MIGIFDSGSGGLTVLRAIREVIPSADVIYFGDIKNAPYGSRSREELSRFTMHALELLHARGARNIVSACNSVSASLAVSLFDAFDLSPTQLIEMVGPTVAYFKGSPARLLLCATPATTQSGIYQDAFHMIGKEVEVVAVPDLAGAIEFGKNSEEVVALIKKALAQVNWQNIDALVLACTHYPLAIEEFKKVVPPLVVIFDPAIAVGERVEKRFWPQEVGEGTTQFLISADSPQFRELVARLFPNQAHTVEVV